MNAPLDNFTSELAAYRENLAAANLANKAALFPLLDAAGITSVTVEFDGEGDSGQIASIVALTGQEERELPVGFVTLQRVCWNEKPTALTTTAREAVETLCYDYLEQEHGGWENNDGGWGEFTFHVAEQRVELDFNMRYSDSTSFSHTF